MSTVYARTDGKRRKARGKLAGLLAVALVAALASAVPSVASPVDPADSWATVGWDDAAVLEGVDFTDYPGSLYAITRSIKADRAWSSGYTGFGIDIAVIDTGVAPVEMLSPDWKLINGPDLSFESQNLDTI